MSRRFRTQIFYSVLAFIAVILLFLVLSSTTSWHWYFVWLISTSIIAFLYYAIDKGLSKAGSVRIPELVLHLLSLIGGFIGALLGMLVFRHKSNFRAHPLFLPIILVSAIIWGFLAYRLFWQ
ncbi:MAG: DUF1294 domain-containing protein [Chloroflexota bacterium]|jgi:uncharacterized membrane protein YsdA (DUF1294 family)